VSDYKPKEGDYVRVVLEGQVEYLTGGDSFMLNTNGIYPDQEHVVSVEKIEPPVEVFKPGDVVRSKDAGVVRALGDRGYVIVKSAFRHDNGLFVSYDTTGLRSSDFTSDKHEKIDID